ncbi:MAG TPA: hypothetical protein VFO08_08400 [Methylomirabilota bacterium]|jgi:hypothetical protein|nr:hypothetical protein [Methylomirabilota bacterium]
MTGLLVDYTVTKDGQHVFTRRTSLTRGDTGSGACEILYVTGLSVVARGDHRQAEAARLLWYASLALLLALGGVWFARPPVVECDRASATALVRVDQVLLAGGLLAVDRDLLQA